MSGVAIVVLAAGACYVVAVIMILGFVSAADREIELREQPDEVYDQELDTEDWRKWAKEMAEL